ncbi:MULTISPECIES: AI-2E family transporter [unclassified Enterococcus]|uniref:AI-2E family transporter n=1 Tax=unclassified Enterococcus TaxID=2608891 RepID=UPI001CE20CF4|nr:MULTISPECIES: AI-2E family transporter [unclassified Enterococcus]MCA5014173.1 AI-2E family transporter [Enterococcus sp. S23]MCA5017607.1 AI-2E family transporter [Enterococcus sp. S22(2020)]
MDLLKKSKMVAILAVLILIGTTIFIFSKVAFIFRPLEAIVSSILLPILISVFIFYIFLPIFKQLERITKRRNLSVFLIVLLILSVVFIGIQVVMPMIITEIGKFVAQIPTIIYSISQLVESSVLEEKVTPLLESLDLNQMGRVIIQVISGARSSLSGIVEVISHSAIIIFTIPLLLVYMFKDGEKIPSKLQEITPEDYQQLVKDWCRDFHNAASTYISGKMMVCAYVGVSSYLVFKILGLPNALLLGLICGLMDIVPYFGPFIGVIPALLYALSQDLKTAILLILFITAIQFGESYLVSPIVMNKVSKIHPIIAVFLLLIAGNLLGFLGMIVALPMYTIIRGMVRTFIDFRKKCKRRVDSGVYASEKIKN